MQRITRLPCTLDTSNVHRIAWTNSQIFQRLNLPSRINPSARRDRCHEEKRTGISSEINATNRVIVCVIAAYGTGFSQPQVARARRGRKDNRPIGRVNYRDYRIPGFSSFRSRVPRCRYPWDVNRSCQGNSGSRDYRFVARRGCKYSISGKTDTIVAPFQSNQVTRHRFGQNFPLNRR